MDCKDVKVLVEKMKVCMEIFSDLFQFSNIV
jgi:hypothetical protein